MRRKWHFLLMISVLFVIADYNLAFAFPVNPHPLDATVSDVQLARFVAGRGPGGRAFCRGSRARRQGSRRGRPISCGWPLLRWRLVRHRAAFLGWPVVALRRGLLLAAGPNRLRLDLRVGQRLCARRGFLVGQNNLDVIGADPILSNFQSWEREMFWEASVHAPCRYGRWRRAKSDLAYCPD